MTCFTENEHEAFTSIPTWPCEWPEVVVRDSIVAPELGTQANPIVIGDGPAPLGSASNPIVIHVDEGWCRDETDQLDSDADTEIMATPEFWGSLAGADFAVPVKDDAAIDSSVRVPIRSLVCEDPEDLQPFEQSTPNGFQSDYKALEVTESSFDELRESPRFGDVRRASVPSDRGGREQSTEQGKASKTEEHEEARSVPDTSSMTRKPVPQDISIQTDNSCRKGLSRGSCDIGSTKRRLSHATAENMNRIKCIGKAASTWGSSVSTAIGDELAAIDDHMDHCRNANCLHAKAFFNGIQSPQDTQPNSLNMSKQPQGRSEEGRVTMRFHVPEFQKGATWPMEFLVDQVIIRTAFFSPNIPCSLEIFKQDDILFGRGAVVLPSEREDPKFFLTFSPKVLEDNHGTKNRKREPIGDAAFTGRVSIELYKRWPPLASDYEERQDFFGSVVLSIHSDGVDPKCFITFSSEQSTANCKLHSPPCGRGKVSQAGHFDDPPEPSMTSGAVTQETAEASHFVGKDLPRSSQDARSVKRELSHDGIRAELRRSERLTKRART